MSPTSLPPLPHWQTTPDDLPAAIREIKAAIRARMEAAGTSPEAVFDDLEERIAAKVEKLKEIKARGENPWPVIRYEDLQDETRRAELAQLVRERGCAVIKGHFPREQALQWDADIVDYTEKNSFFENYRGPGDDFFGTVGSKPEIYPIYWSKPQMEARQSERMATVQAFLNSIWAEETDGDDWFNPNVDSLYPDRIRRRPPGADSAGLGAHIDPGTLDLWMTEEYQRTFAPLFEGRLDDYSPWNAAHRTSGPQYPGTTMCSAFRTFQGWTALSDMKNDQGVLQTVPIPEAMAYLMLRPLVNDVPEDDMCGVTVNQVFPVNWKWHPHLMEALSVIPDVEAGDSVWWHCDMVHAVEDVTDQQGWGNVMYIPAAPWCPRNETYAESVRTAFATGASPADFPEENYEVDWVDRFTEADLNPIGRRGLGLDA